MEGFNLKKILALASVLVITLSLSACGSPAQEPPAASGDGLSGESQGSQAVGQPVTPDGTADAPSGTEYNASPAKLFANQDALVFEFTSPAVAEFDKLRAQPDIDLMGFIKLPQFEVELSRFNQDPDLTVRFQNYAVDGASAVTSPVTPDYRIRWSIVGEKLTVACFSHKYDVSQLENPENGHLEVRLINSKEGQELCNDGFLLNKLPISGEIPEDLTAPLTVENTYSTGDFDLFQYASPKTDDYFLELSIGGTPVLTVISYDEAGRGVYVETISFQEYPDPNGAFGDDAGGHKYHPDNPQISISYAICNDTGFTKEKAFYSYIGFDGKSGYDHANYKKYFSSPTLYPTQMGYAR